MRRDFSGNCFEIGLDIDIGLVSGFSFFLWISFLHIEKQARFIEKDKAWRFGLGFGTNQPREIGNVTCYDAHMR